MSRKSKSPVGFSPAARKLWLKITKEYDIADSAGLAILTSAMESFDRAAAAKRVVDLEGPVVMDRWGQRKVHPAANVELANRAAFLNALRQLNLDVEVNNRGPGRPPADWKE